MAEAARYVMIGGFLGAGKTTAIAKLARRLTDQGHRVGLITNDQSSGLVDTRMLQARGFAVEEIAGGCFCCRFDSLSEAAEKLTRDARPEIFLAEPVGSCTDLLATVSYPLRRMYGDRYHIAPLSVLVDPIRAGRILGLIEGKSFSKKVVYVYEKQLEEAHIIVVNKCDTLEDDRRDRLVAALESKFPRAEVITASALDGDGLDDWLDRITGPEGDVRPTMEVDYELYGQGEALLGWLNATITVTASAPFDGDDLLLRFAEGMRSRVMALGGEIAHLKMTLDSGGDEGLLSTVSVVRCDGATDVRDSVDEAIDGGSLILNLRAELDPERIISLVVEALEDENRAEGGITMRLDHEEHFRPAQPVPTHRIVVGERETPFQP